MKFYKHIFILSLLFVLPLQAQAHPGDDLADANGCHHCWTNCSNWGLSYGQLHCHAKQTPLPTNNCYTYKSAQTGCKTEQDYKNFYDSHVLPLLSVGDSLESAEKTFDYQLQKCKQEIVNNAEYEVKFQECQTSYDKLVKQLFDLENQKNEYYTKSTECLQKYGSNANYDQNANACSCKDGYRINESVGKCVPHDLCNESDPHALTMFNKCLCFSNYLIDPDTKKCTDANSVCKKLFGQNAYYDETGENCKQPIVVNKQEEVITNQPNQPNTKNNNDQTATQNKTVNDKKDNVTIPQKLDNKPFTNDKPIKLEIKSKDTTSSISTSTNKKIDNASTTNKKEKLNIGEWIRNFFAKLKNIFGK